MNLAEFRNMKREIELIINDFKTSDNRSKAYDKYVERLRDIEEELIDMMKPFWCMEYKEMNKEQRLTDRRIHKLYNMIYDEKILHDDLAY